MIARLYIQDGCRLLSVHYFTTEDEADTYTEGYHAGASEFGGCVTTINPNDEAVVSLFLEELGGDPERACPDRGVAWTTLIEQARAGTLDRTKD